MNIGERLKELRSEKNLSQMELSKATGISQSSIARWELNKSEPTASDIIVLAKFFGESADYLLCIINDLNFQGPAELFKSSAGPLT